MPSINIVYRLRSLANASVADGHDTLVLVSPMFQWRTFRLSVTKSRQCFNGGQLRLSDVTVTENRYGLRYHSRSRYFNGGQSLASVLVAGNNSGKKLRTPVLNKVEGLVRGVFIKEAA